MRTVRGLLGRLKAESVRGPPEPGQQEGGGGPFVGGRVPRKAQARVVPGVPVRRGCLLELGMDGGLTGGAGSTPRTRLIRPPSYGNRKGMLGQEANQSPQTGRPALVSLARIRGVCRGGERGGVTSI